jgi:hypothetical protein
VLSGSAQDLQSIRVPAVMGEMLELKLTAKDGAGNKIGSRILRTQVANDDAATTHSAEYFGLWEERAQPGAAFDGIHVSQTPLDTFSFTGTGEDFCISYQPGPEYGVAILTVDGIGRIIDMSEPDHLMGNRGCINSNGREATTAELTIESGVINVDSFWIQ